jgi:hypothetical protein
MEKRALGWMYLAGLCALVASVIWVGLAACRPPYLGGVCQVGEMRCHENVAQICASDRTWIPALDCVAISAHAGRPWVCVALPSDGGVPVSGPLDAGVFDDEEFTCRPEASTL